MHEDLEEFARSGAGSVADAHVANRPRVGFLFVGGEHQMLHIAPVAVELRRRGLVDVEAFVASPEQKAALERLTAQLGMRLPLTLLPAPLWAKLIGLIISRWSSLKLPRLLAARRMFAHLDVLVVSERTSTMLKRLPGPKPYLVHIPHGAGDRAKGFERRIAMFDHVIVAGSKDRDRMIAEGVATPETCSVSGYVKRAAIRASAEMGAPIRLFRNDRPVVLYNPHFAPGLSSWAKFGDQLVEAFRSQDAFNLIVAPHVRFRDALSLRDRERLAALALNDRIIVDLGSERSHDMTYTLGADVYIGDVSSQVYEFLSSPKPCVFLNTGIEDWAADPSFASWRLGEVVDDPASVPDAVARAVLQHPEFADAQQRAARAAMGPLDFDAVGRAAEIVTVIAQRRAAARAHIAGHGPNLNCHPAETPRPPVRTGVS